MKRSTPKGQRADKDTSPGPHIETLISVVDHRSVFTRTKNFDRRIEAKYDSGESVSCCSFEIYDSLKLKRSLKLEPELRRLKAANQLTIVTRDVVRLPVNLGGRKLEHNFFLSWLNWNLTA